MVRRLRPQQSLSRKLIDNTTHIDKYTDVTLTEAVKWRHSSREREWESTQQKARGLREEDDHKKMETQRTCRSCLTDLVWHLFQFGSIHVHVQSPMNEIFSLGQHIIPMQNSNPRFSFLCLLDSQLSTFDTTCNQETLCRT